MFFFFQDASLNNETLVSPVLAASVANLSVSNLSENIQFTIRNINPINVSIKIIIFIQKIIKIKGFL